MKKTIKIFLALTLMLLSFGLNIKDVSASEATTYTFTVDQKGNMVRTQDAYLPDGVNISLKMKNPDDMIFDEDDNLWIADSGNKRIIKYDSYEQKVLAELKYHEFIEPRGVFVSKLGIYVADSRAQAVFKFNDNLEFVEKIEKPDNPSFEGTPFSPSKLVVDNRGNIYIYGEGVSNGIIQLTNKGEFLGFFTTNKVKLSFIQQLYKKILSKDQFDKLNIRSPFTFSSLFIDKEQMIYTSTSNTKNNAVKKHNMQGSNIFNNTISSDDAKDIYVDNNGIIYSGMQSGSIYIYDSNGDYIYSFGPTKKESESNQNDIAGMFKKLSAIAVRSDGQLFALDSDKNFLQSFRQTSYSKKIYESIQFYENRKYEESIDSWNEVLSLNQMSVLAHNNIAKSYLQLQNYDKANEHFKIASNKTGYSESYWEIRNNSIQKYLGSFIVLGLIIYLASISLKFVDKKTGSITGFINPIKEKFNYKIIKDLLFVFTVMKKPSDSYYELKKKNHGSLISANILYLITFLVFIFYSTSKGFIYQAIGLEDLDINTLIIGFFIMTMILVFVNYLDTSIHDGLGGIREIFIMFIYSLGPIVISMFTTTILSHVLTLNETFFLDFIMFTGIGWTMILLFIGIMETHEYSGIKTLKSMFMSILFLVIIVIVIIIVLTMWKQLITFIELILKEMIRNVFN